MHLPRLILLLPLLVSAACDASEPPPAAARPAAQPAEVGVLTVAPTPVTLTRELPGRVVARRVAEVRARVSGIVEKRLFEEGSDVKEGQLLYRIEPEPYEASLAAARANLARAEAALPAARDLARRDQELLRTGAVSIEAAERSAAQLRQLEAEIAANRAAVKSAKINREYTTVTAPISGRIGRSYVTEGAYVQAGA
ncbi:MAG TPA: efflux RND transporter periplasmic adaptor subunit, partial [Nannocystis sp.]